MISSPILHVHLISCSILVTQMYMGLRGNVHACIFFVRNYKGLIIKPLFLLPIPIDQGIVHKILLAPPPIFSQFFTNAYTWDHEIWCAYMLSHYYIGKAYQFELGIIKLFRIIFYLGAKCF